MESDPQFQQMLDKLNAGARSAEFTVEAPEDKKEAPIRLRNMLDGLWTEGTRQTELLAAAEREGFENLPNAVTLTSEIGPIRTDEGLAFVSLALTIEVSDEDEEEQDG